VSEHLAESDFSVAVDGLHFAEGPRWNDGYLWFSDMFGHRVLRHQPGPITDGVVAATEEVVAVPDDRPSGLGWLPDGRLLVVAMKSRRLLRLDGPGRLAVHADLSDVCRGFANDMIVAADGTAYVGDSGLPEFGEPGERQPGQVLKVTPDGGVSTVADELVVPNGCVLTEDGRTFILVEAHAGRITAFDVSQSGDLRRRRPFAVIDVEAGASSAHPDGMCLDAEGAIWVCEIAGRRVLRIREGGQVVQSIPFRVRTPVACVLGGEDRRSLYVCASGGGGAAELAGSKTGAILVAAVDIPGAGRP
jgi:sugar lactone lactonase YvrE